MLGRVRHVEMHQRDLDDLAVGFQGAIKPAPVRGGLGKAQRRLRHRMLAISSTRCSSVGPCGACSATRAITIA